MQALASLLTVYVEHSRSMVATPTSCTHPWPAQALVGPAPSRGGQRCWDPEHDHEGGQQGQLPCSSFLVSGSCDSISSLGLNWHKWRRVSGVWSVTRECGHEKVHALVVSLRTKRRKKKKTEREERRRRKVGLTHVRKQKAREESKLRHHRQLSVTAALVD